MESAFFFRVPLEPPQAIHNPSENGLKVSMDSAFFFRAPLALPLEIDNPSEKALTTLSLLTTLII